MNTDTPRTDAASFSSRDPLELLQTSQQLERELAISLENQCKAQAEVVALAQAIHSRTDPYPEWAICDSVTGIISQINNMVGGVLDRAEKAEAEVERLRELVKYAVWVLKSYNPKYAEEIEASLTPPTEPPNARAEKAESEVEKLTTLLRLALPHIPPNAVDQNKIMTEPISECWLDMQIKKALNPTEK